MINFVCLYLIVSNIIGVQVTGLKIGDHTLISLGCKSTCWLVWQEVTQTSTWISAARLCGIT
jgi:hypothetical protein